MSADLSVVVCSLNGAAGVHRCLHGLRAQSTSARLEIIVVDDGSTDDTAEVARRHGAIVVRHAVNRGIAAARNSGIAITTAPVVAFLDDDCEPAEDWADQLLAGYGPGIAGVGAEVVPRAPARLVQRYLERHNPLQPLELSLAGSQRIGYRLRLYLLRQWRPCAVSAKRDVYSLVGASMSFRRDVLLSTSGFDARFNFGAEEVDFCLRLERRNPPARLVHLTDARVMHHFRPSLHDILRRSRAYGLGSARLFRKWPDVPPTVFPGPLLVVAVLALSAVYLPLAVVAAVLPVLLYPQGLRFALAGAGLSCLLDGYIQLCQETCEDIGFAEGLWKFRHLIPAPAAPGCETPPGCETAPAVPVPGQEPGAAASSASHNGRR